MSLYEGCRALSFTTGEAEIIPVKPDAGNAAVGMSRILSFVRTLLCTFLMIFNCNIRAMDSKYIPTLTIAVPTVAAVLVCKPI